MLDLRFLNDIFPDVYVLYISRDRTVSRLWNQLAGVRAEWIEGTETADGYTLDELRSEVQRLAGAHCLPLNPNIKPKGLCIWLSMRRIDDLILTSGRPALVLESDAYFLPEAVGWLRSALEDELPKDWRYLKLWDNWPTCQADTPSTPGRRMAPPLPEDEISSTGPCYWEWLNNPNSCDCYAYGPEIVSEHIYRPCYARIGTVATGRTPEAIEAVRAERVIWNSDWGLGCLTIPGHPLYRHCYGLTPFPVWPVAA